MVRKIRDRLRVKRLAALLAALVTCQLSAGDEIESRSGISRLRVEPRGETGVVLSWQSAADRDIAFFYVFREATAVAGDGIALGFSEWDIIGTVPAQGSAQQVYEDTHLRPGFWYCYRVQAAREKGQRFPLSDLVCTQWGEPTNRIARAHDHDHPPAQSQPLPRTPAAKPTQLPVDEPLPEYQKPKTAPQPPTDPRTPSACGEPRVNQIEGRVTRGGQPLVDVEIMLTYRLPGIPEYKYFTRTNMDGRYCFPDLEIGEVYRIYAMGAIDPEISALRFKPLKHKIKIRKERVGNADFTAE